MDISCILCEVETVDLCIPVVYMNASLPWVTHQNYKLWKWMLFVIDDIAYTAESVNSRCKSAPLFRSISYSRASQPYFRGGTTDIYIYI